MRRDRLCSSLDNSLHREPFEGMVVAQSSVPTQLPLRGILPPSSEAEAIRVLRDAYIQNNGDLRPFFEGIVSKLPKNSGSTEVWTIDPSILSKSVMGKYSR